MDVLYQPLDGAPPPHTSAWVDDLLDDVGGALGTLVGRGFAMTRDGLSGSLLTFWPNATTAGRSAPPAAAGGIRLGDPPQYTVVREHRRTVPSGAGYLQVTRFEGPKDSVWGSAFERASSERIWPATRDVPGIVGAYLCRAADGGALALTLASSVEALEAALRAVMSTDLLPGEDPALLTGPTRSTSSGSSTRTCPPWPHQQTPHPRADSELAPAGDY